MVRLLFLEIYMKNLFRWFVTNELFINFNIFLFIISLIYALSISYKINGIVEFIFVILLLHIYNNVFMIPAYVANTNKLDSEDIILITTIAVMIMSDFFYYLSVLVWFLMLAYVIFNEDIRKFIKKDKNERID